MERKTSLSRRCHRSRSTLFWSYVIWALFAQTFEWRILCGRFMKCSHYCPILVIITIVICSWTRWERRCKDQMKKTHQRSCEHVIRYLIYSVNLELFCFVCSFVQCLSTLINNYRIWRILWKQSSTTFLVMLIGEVHLRVLLFCSGNGTSFDCGFSVSK